MLLLDRNGIWNEQCAKYLSDIIERCPNCKIVQLPSGSRKVSIRSMSRSFNDIVCIDHLFLEQNDVVHFMDAQTRYSSGLLVPTTNMHDAICAFESKWMSEFWPPKYIQGDKAFLNEEFKSYLKLYDISFRPVPPRRHSKNVLESKHRVLRDVYLRLKSSREEEDPNLLVAKMFRVSNDLYGNNYVSSHELAKGYTRPVTHDYPRILPQDIITAQETLSAKRKLNLILSSKSIHEFPLHVGDYVQVYTRLQNQKRGHWSEPKPILSIDPESKLITVPGKSGRRRDVAIEDVRCAMLPSPFAVEIQQSIDLLSNDLEETLDQFKLHESIGNHSIGSNSQTLDDSDYSSDVGNDEGDDESPEETFHEIAYNRLPVTTPYETIDITDELLTHYPAVASNFDFDHPEDDTEIITAGNGEPGTMSSRWTEDPAPSTHHMQLRHERSAPENKNSTIEGNSIELLPGTELTSQEQDALKLYHLRFQGKEFSLHSSEGFPSYIDQNSYAQEEQNFLKQCILVPRISVPQNSNIIRSHVLYKIKRRDDGSLTCKARIAPHGNEDRDKEHLKTDSACCPPLGTRILYSLCVLFHWYLTKIDVKGAFLQTGRATRDVYVIPPRKCEDRRFIWLLTVASYGLVNANAKWQLHSDQTLQDLGLIPCVHVSQLFFLKAHARLVLILVKVTDDILIAGDEGIKQTFINKLSSVYELGTITHLPGKCWFFGLQVQQDNSYTIQVDADTKLAKLVPYNLSRTRRKDAQTELNALETFHYNSLNGSIGFIGVYALPIAAFVSSYLQQRWNSATVHDLILHVTMIRRLKQYGSIIRYCRPPSGSFQMSVLLFADAVRPSGNGQLGVICGILFGSLSQFSTFHVISWYSQLSERPVKSIGSAEVLATGLAIQEGLPVCSGLSDLLGISIPVIVIVDSKDLFDSLTSCHIPEDRAILGDILLIRHYFETRKIHKVIWIPGSLNLADPLTKKDSPLSESLTLLMFEGRLPFEFETSRSKTSELNVG